MREYLKVNVVNAEKVESFLEEGWEIIDNEKVGQFEGGSLIRYHIGFPAKVKIERLISIIKRYEKFGLKEELFRAVADEFNENLDDYDTIGGYYTDTKLTRFLENYEKMVNDNEVEYYKSDKKEKSDSDFF